MLAIFNDGQINKRVVREMFHLIFPTGVIVPIAVLCTAAVMMGMIFMWCRKKRHVRLIPKQTERDDKVGRTKVQLSAIGKDDAETEGIFSVLILFTQPIQHLE